MAGGQADRSSVILLTIAPKADPESTARIARITVLGEGCLQNWPRARALFPEVSQHLDRQEPLTRSLPEI